MTYYRVEVRMRGLRALFVAEFDTGEEAVGYAREALSRARKLKSEVVDRGSVKIYLTAISDGGDEAMTTVEMVEVPWEEEKTDG